jgi:cytosine/adenosine deaminase-related metal-dependent hydrolase
MSRPAIRDGAVLVRGHRIVAAGRWKDLSCAQRQVLDLGDVVLMPGLVNAHCHLDYTHMSGQFPPPDIFIDWLKAITEAKSGWDLSDYRASWQAGADMLLQTGTTTVVDMEAVPQLLPDSWDLTLLRTFSFLEMIGITTRRPAKDLLQEALAKSTGLRHRRCRVGLSPHAPYSTLPELLRHSAQASRKRRWLLSTHVAESASEFEMFAHGRGVMYDWLQRSGRDMADCGEVSPVRHLEKHGFLGPNLLAAHVNYLRQGDAATLSRRGVSVVHCPRSHHYFRHAPFPFRVLSRAGVNICLGTDSLASVYQRRAETVRLSMFDEMRALDQSGQGISPGRIVRMATVNGARALGLQRRLGEISAGAYADLIAFPLEHDAPDLYEAVLQHKGVVAASMINGTWAIPPASLRRLD